MSNNLLRVLKDQHVGVKNQMVAVIDSVKSNNPKVIFSELQIFHKLLSENLDLENNKLYPGLINKLRNNKIELESICKFVTEMSKIEVAVSDFLKKYNKASVIGKDITKFTNDFEDIVKTLSIRIESEEDGIYLYW